jgi:cytochrome b
MPREPATDAYLLWDIPTRFFHWAIVCCLPLAWWSAEQEHYDVHQWVGYTVIVLVVSRIVWGVVGSRHSRFNDFLAGPGRVLAYLKGERDAGPGHNPLGGWSVVVLLSLLLLQVVSGLFNTDDVLFSGPLYYAASGDFRDAMGQVHDVAFNALVAMVCLHILAVLYHQFVRREPLVAAMVKGRAPGREGLASPAPGWRALLILLAAAGALWWGLSLAPQPEPIMW